MGNSKDSKDSRVPPALGPLETEVMDVVWASGEASVRDVYRVLLKRREIAYTTVMTVMSNLLGKGVLKRHRQGRAYVYIPAVSRDEFIRARIVELVDGMVGRFTEPAMTYLVDQMSQVAPQRLAELEAAIIRLRKKHKEGPRD